MKKYFAWVFFVLGVVNVTNVSYQYATGGELPKMLFATGMSLGVEGLMGFISNLLIAGASALFLYLWYRWK